MHARDVFCHGAPCRYVPVVAFKRGWRTDRAQNALDRTRAFPSQATQKLLLTSDGTFRGVSKNYEVADGICISVVYPDD
jgi:hypothetical protein